MASRTPDSDNKVSQQLAAELTIAKEEIAFLNGEIKAKSQELILADIKLNFQSLEIEQRTAELIIANNELVWQNAEKEKRAAELRLANEQLLFQNIEKEKRAAELSTANSELESFSYSISHDLRAPLRAVNGFAKILEEDYGSSLDNEGKRLLDIIQENAKRMGLLIDDLLSFSRLGTKKLHKSNVNTAWVVDNVLKELNPESATIILKNLAPVVADKALIQQVWMNLLSNAIKYSRNVENPCIIIDSEIKNGDIVFTISDNGVGFDMQYVNKLFDVFQRLHSAEKFEGTGVGLALVQRIIHKHEGKIWASAEPGKGATFYFSLPDQTR